MDMSPYLLEFEIKERRRVMLAEANRQRLVNLSTPAYHSKLDKLFLSLAELLITLGEKLKRRHAPQEALESGLCRE